jgi:predicted secreted protein
MIRWYSIALLPFSVAAYGGCHDAGPPPANAADTSVANAASPSAPGASASGAPSAVGAAPGAQETVIHVDDDGKSFDVARGSIVTVSLASNAGTGYRWVPTKVDANVLAQQGDRAVESASPNATVPGGPTNEVYRFSAASPGTTSLEMSLKRPFGSGDPGRVVRVTINVH